MYQTYTYRFVTGLQNEEILIELCETKATVERLEKQINNYDNIWINDYYQNSYSEIKYRNDRYRRDDGIIFGTDGKVYTFESPNYDPMEFPYGKKAFKCSKAISGSCARLRKWKLKNL